MRSRSDGWVDGEVELGPVDPGAGPPVHRNPKAGTTKYPFGDMQVNQLLYLRRDRGTVKDALFRYGKTHKGERFACWRGADGRTVVKRVK